MKTRYAIWDKNNSRNGEFEFLIHCQANWSKSLNKVKKEFFDLRNNCAEYYTAEEMKEFDKSVKILCLQVETVNDKWEKEQKAAIARSTPIAGGYL